MFNIYDIRMILTVGFLTGIAGLAGHGSAFFTLQGHGVDIGQCLLPRARLPHQHIGMGDLVLQDGVLHVADDLLMSNDRLKIFHKDHLLFRLFYHLLGYYITLGLEDIAFF